MINTLFFMSIGIIFLFVGGDGIVRSSVTIADKLNLPILLISSIVIGFGTSAPELLVSLQAALQEHPEIAIGNAVGSNISNTLLVLGMAACITPIPCQAKLIKLDALMIVIASIFLVYLSALGFIYRLNGVFMLTGLGTYIFLKTWYEKKESKKALSKEEKKLQKQIKQEFEGVKSTLAIALLMALTSLILLTAGAHLLIDNAITLANYFNVSESVIGLTLVAIGSSLPEITTVCIASWRKHPDIVIGNLLGSNLFNILLILGLTALIKPIPFVGQLAKQDVWVLLATAVLLLSVILIYKKVNRIWGFLFLIIYMVYILWLYLSPL